MTTIVLGGLGWHRWRFLRKEGTFHANKDGFFSRTIARHYEVARQAPFRAAPLELLN